MMRMVAGMGVLTALVVSTPVGAQPAPPEPVVQPDTPPPPVPPPADPPPVDPPPAEEPEQPPPPPPAQVPPPVPPPPAQPAPNVPPPAMPPPPAGWGPAPGGWNAPPGSFGGRPVQPPPVAEPGPFYADVAAWSSILSTLVPMFGGFMLVATARRDDSFNQGITNEEEIGMQVGGFTLVGLGTIVGPSIGHLYAGDTMWGLGGMGLRLLFVGGAAGFMSAGAVVAEDRDGEVGGGILMAFGVASASAGLGLAIYDIFDAPEAARRANREQRLKQNDMSYVPQVDVGVGSLNLRWTN